MKYLKERTYILLFTLLYLNILTFVHGEKLEIEENEDFFENVSSMKPYIFSDGKDKIEDHKIRKFVNSKSNETTHKYAYFGEGNETPHEVMDEKEEVIVESCTPSRKVNSPFFALNIGSPVPRILEELCSSEEVKNRTFSLDASQESILPHNEKLHSLLKFSGKPIGAASKSIEVNPAQQTTSLANVTATIKDNKPRRRIVLKLGNFEKGVFDINADASEKRGADIITNNLNSTGNTTKFSFLPQNTKVIEIEEKQKVDLKSNEDQPILIKNNLTHSTAQSFIALQNEKTGKKKKIILLDSPKNKSIEKNQTANGIKKQTNNYLQGRTVFALQQQENRSENLTSSVKCNQNNENMLKDALYLKNEMIYKNPKKYQKNVTEKSFFLNGKDSKDGNETRLKTKENAKNYSKYHVPQKQNKNKDCVSHKESDLNARNNKNFKNTTSISVTEPHKATSFNLKSKILHFLSYFKNKKNRKNLEPSISSLSNKSKKIENKNILLQDKFETNELFKVKKNKSGVSSSVENPKNSILVPLPKAEKFFISPKPKAQYKQPLAQNSSSDMLILPISNSTVVAPSTVKTITNCIRLKLNHEIKDKKEQKQNEYGNIILLDGETENKITNGCSKKRIENLVERKDFEEVYPESTLGYSEKSSKNMNLPKVIASSLSQGLKSQEKKNLHNGIPAITHFQEKINKSRTIGGNFPPSNAASTEKLEIGTIPISIHFSQKGNPALNNYEKTEKFPSKNVYMDGCNSPINKDGSLVVSKEFQVISHDDDCNEFVSDKEHQQIATSQACFCFSDNKQRKEDDAAERHKKNKYVTTLDEFQKQEIINSEKYVLLVPQNKSNQMEINSKHPDASDVNTNKNFCEEQRLKTEELDNHDMNSKNHIIMIETNKSKAGDNMTQLDNKFMINYPVNNKNPEGTVQFSKHKPMHSLNLFEKNEQLAKTNLNIRELNSNEEITEKKLNFDAGTLDWNSKESQNITEEKDINSSTNMSKKDKNKNEKDKKQMLEKQDTSSQNNTPSKKEKSLKSKIFHGINKMLKILSSWNFSKKEISEENKNENTHENLINKIKSRNERIVDIYEMESDNILSLVLTGRSNKNSNIKIEHKLAQLDRKNQWKFAPKIVFFKNTNKPQLFLLNDMLKCKTSLWSLKVIVTGITFFDGEEFLDLVYLDNWKTPNFPKKIKINSLIYSGLKERWTFPLEGVFVCRKKYETLHLVIKKTNKINSLQGTSHFNGIIKDIKILVFKSKYIILHMNIFLSNSSVISPFTSYPTVSSLNYANNSNHDTSGNDQFDSPVANYSTNNLPSSEQFLNNNKSSKFYSNKSDKTTFSYPNLNNSEINNINLNKIKDSCVNGSCYREHSIKDDKLTKQKDYFNQKDFELKSNHIQVSNEKNNEALSLLFILNFMHFSASTSTYERKKLLRYKLALLMEASEKELQCNFFRGFYGDSDTFQVYCPNFDDFFYNRFASKLPIMLKILGTVGIFLTALGGGYAIGRSKIVKEMDGFAQSQIKAVKTGLESFGQLTGCNNVEEENSVYNAINEAHEKLKKVNANIVITDKEKEIVTKTSETIKTFINLEACHVINRTLENLIVIKKDMLLFFQRLPYKSLFMFKTGLISLFLFFGVSFIAYLLDKHQLNTMTSNLTIPYTRVMEVIEPPNSTDQDLVLVLLE